MRLCRWLGAPAALPSSCITADGGARTRAGPGHLRARHHQGHAGAVPQHHSLHGRCPRGLRAQLQHRAPVSACRAACPSAMHTLRARRRGRWLWDACATFCSGFVMGAVSWTARRHNGSAVPAGTCLAILAGPACRDCRAGLERFALLPESVPGTVGFCTNARDLLRHAAAPPSRHGAPTKGMQGGMQYMITYTQLTHIGAALKGSDQQRLI